MGQGQGRRPTEEQRERKGMCWRLTVCAPRKIQMREGGGLSKEEVDARVRQFCGYLL